MIANMTGAVTLLIVDDRQDNLDALSKLLARGLPRATIIAVGSAEEGLAAIEVVQCDGAIIDVQMPGTDGIEMCRLLKSNPATADVPVILMTGHGADADLKARGLAAGADDFLHKPIDTTELLARINVMLRIRRAEENLRHSEARIRSIFRAAPVGIGVVANRVLLEVNDRVCQMLGYTRLELVGLPARTLYLNDEDYEQVGEKYRQIKELDTGTVETRLRRKDGTVIDVLVSSALLDPTDPESGITFTALDITDRKQAQQKLAAERASLEQKNIALREVMNSVQDEKTETSRRIVGNIDTIVMPILRVMQDQAPPAMQKQVAQAIAGLEEITSPFIDNISQKCASLTPAEIRVCDAIRTGLSTKEVAKLYRISSDTVNNHRRNIRQKFGLSKTGQNLVSYLRTLGPTTAKA